MAGAFAVSTPVEIPPLEAGDSLSREEFHRRYEASPHIRKAELIDGIVYIGPPVKVFHGRAHAWIGAWCGLYSADTPGTQPANRPTVILDDLNEPQPDVVLRIEPEWGGISWDEDGFIAGAPELVVEVAVSGSSKELHQQKRVYEAAGVLEYLVWVPPEERIEWWRLTDGKYVSLPVDPRGIIKSEVLPGLWLSTEGILNEDLPTFFNAVRAGIASPEHAEFVRLLESRKPAE